MSTLTDGTTTVTLSDALAWQDEFTWAPVEQAVRRSLTGALIISTAQRQAGRPITLAHETADRAWMPRSVLNQCRVWAAVAGQQLTLTLRGTAYTVIWRHQDGAIDAAPVWPYTDVDDADAYRATLRFMTI